MNKKLIQSLNLNGFTLSRHQFLRRAFLGVLLMGTSALADETASPRKLKTTHVQAKSVKTQSISQISTRKVTREDIQKRNLTNLRELLQGVQGVRIQDDPQTLASTLSINGMSQKEIRIIVDGVPLIGLVDGNVDISQIPMHQVESVEIIQQASSAEFAGSTGGVIIKITTKRPHSSSQWGSQLGVAYESSERLDQNARVFWGNTFAQSDVHFSRTNQAPIQTEGSRRPLWPEMEIIQWGASQNFQTEHHNLQLQYQGTVDDRPLLGDWIANPESLEFDSEVGEFVAADSNATDLDFITNRHQASGSYLYQPNAQHILRFTQSFTHYHRENITQVTEYASRNQETVQSLEHEFASLFTQGIYENKSLKQLPVTASFEGEYSSVQGPRIQNSFQEMNSLSFSLQAQLQTSKLWQMELALRSQYHSEYTQAGVSEMSFLPALGLQFHPVEGLSFSLGYHKAYYAPTLQEVHFNFNDGGTHAISGNSNLKPENSDQIQFNQSFSKKFKKVEVDQGLHFYYRNMQNKILIAENTDQPGTHSYQNIQSFEHLGVNSSLSLQLDKDWNILGQVGVHGTSALDENNPISGMYLFYKDALGELSYRIPKLGTQLTYRQQYFGSQVIYRIEDGEVSQGRIMDWQQIDILLHQALKTSWASFQISGGVKNLFDVKNLQTFGVTAVGAHQSNGPMAVARGRLYFTNLQMNF